MEPFIDDENQLMFSCENPEVHSYYKRPPTEGSIFDDKVIPLGVRLGIFRDLFRAYSHSSITASRYATHDEINELLRSCTILREGYIRRNFFKEDDKKLPTVLLGDSPECDHLQIGVRKFEKHRSKFERLDEERAPGFWVLGIVEALKTETEGSFSGGEIFYCTIPNRTHHTILPIIFKYCRRDMEIRSGIKHISSQDIADYFKGGKKRNVKNNGSTDKRMNTSIINSGWAQMKRHIASTHFNSEELPLKIMEYIWHQKHKNDMMHGLELCFGQESINYPSQPSDRRNMTFMTCGANGNSPELQKYMDEKATARALKVKAAREKVIETCRLEHELHVESVDKARALRGEPPHNFPFQPEHMKFLFPSESSDDNDYNGIVNAFPLAAPPPRSGKTAKASLDGSTDSSVISRPPPIINTPRPTKPASKTVRYRKPLPVSLPIANTPPPRITKTAPRITKAGRRKTEVAKRVCKALYPTSMMFTLNHNDPIIDKGPIIDKSSTIDKSPIINNDSIIDNAPCVDNTPPSITDISSPISNTPPAKRGPGRPRSTRGPGQPRGRPRSLRTTRRARGLPPK
ncbi:hypothetical protein INT47_009578 [Mucor saturninus]|uniref:Uncharacterized protein n=1 Tax=Mucor saturninus TaxID=64648 RepID=A0A8H7QTQ6_9FUNG|nr:hypothetical protein INT47_009578 [Mucor saturninus]